MRFLLENFVCVLARIVSLITEHAYQQRIKNRTISFSHVSQHTLSDKTISDKSDENFVRRKIMSKKENFIQERLHLQAVLLNKRDEIC